MLVKAIKNFPYSSNGIKVVNLKKGDEIEVRDAEDVESLVKLGYFEKVTKVKSVSQAPVNKKVEVPSNKDFSSQKSRSIFGKDKK